MSKRRKVIIAVIVIIIIIAVAALLWWWLSRRPAPAALAPAVNANVGLQIPAALPSANVALPAVPAGPVKQADVEADLKAAAMTFAERFGSYSNEGNFSNLDALKALMTVKMRASADAYFKALPVFSSANKGVYYGITTQALSAEIKTYDQATGRAEVLVSTQRREAQGSPANPAVFYQNLSLQLAKIGSEWQIDAAQWQGR